MLHQRHKIILGCQRTADILLIIASFIGAYFIKKFMLPQPYSGLTNEPNYYFILILIIAIWYICLNWFGIYRSYRDNPLYFFIIRILKSCFTGFMALTLFLYLIKEHNISRIMLGIFMILNIISLIGFRWLVKLILIRVRSKGNNIKNILIVGSHQKAMDIILFIHRNMSSGYRIVGCLDSDTELKGSMVECNGQKIKIIGTIAELQPFCENNVVDEIIFTMPLRKIEKADKYIVIAESMGIRVRIIPDWDIAYLSQSMHNHTFINIMEFCGMPMLTFNSTPINEGQLIVKSFMDYSLGAVFMLLFLPFFAITSIFILIISPGGRVFFRQKRLGEHGRIFDMLKFRTMVPDAEERLEALKSLNECDGPAFKIKNDPRIIPFIGTFLRKTGLDELPQLINVLKGEMSLVGPRPPIPCEVQQYELWQRRRLSMKPGLTCFWQIAPSRNDISFDEWIKLDLQYIDNWSIWLDFILIFKTARAVITGSGR
ncbi:MAG: sugar transferase [Desulfamplus sp.]|nr:sugar transferase [Desulfamplus sp.]